MAACALLRSACAHMVPSPRALLLLPPCRGYSWIQRLRIEETITGYDQQLCESQGFHFENEMVKGLRVARIKLEGVGPKMLVSSISTADTDFLHWHLELLGNQAVEFGVIPLEMQVGGAAC